MNRAVLNNLLPLLIAGAVIGGPLAWGSAPEGLRHYICAALFYAIGVILLLVCLASGGRVNWRGGIPASLATQIVFLALFFVWGTVSLGTGLGWSFAVNYGLLLDSGMFGLVVLLGTFDRFVYRRDY